MNIANLASMFPNPAMNLAALAGWPSPSLANSMNPVNPPAAWYIPMYLPQLASQSPIPMPVGTIPVNSQPTCPAAPVAPGCNSPAFFIIALSPNLQVPLPPGSNAPSPSAFLMVIPMPQPQSRPSFAPAPSPVGLPPVAQAAGYPPIGIPSSLEPISIGHIPQPVLGSSPMTTPASPMTPLPSPLGQPWPSFAPPIPVPMGSAPIAYLVQPIPTPPGSAPMYGPPIPVFAMPPSPVTAPAPSSMMPPPPPAPPQMAEGAGRGEAAHVLSPEFPNGAGVIADLRAVRNGRAVSPTAPQGAGGVGRVGVGADPELPTGRGPRQGSSQIDDEHPTRPLGSGTPPEVRPVRKPRHAMNGKH